MIKNKISIVMALSTLAVLSCSKKEDYKAPDIKIDQKYEDILKSLRSGGQPGEIILGGAAVDSDGSANDKISIEQSVGKSDEDTKLSERSTPKLNSDLKRKDDYKPSSLGAYLNVGCDLTGDSRIEGLKEQKNKPNEFGITDTFGAAASMVDKIFVCGSVDLKESVVVLNANEIYFQDAELKKENQIGLISITADTLVVEGKNLISTSGLSDSSASLISAPDIRLNVYDQLGGTGELKLVSKGGDYIKRADK